MPTQPFYSPKFRAFDASGDPLAGGLLYSYEAGTSTPLDTFTTRAGDIANDNPVELDANGEADVWTTPGLLYKFVLADSDDVIQWTVDNVPSAGESGGSGGGGGGTSSDAAVSVEPGGRLSLASGQPVPTSDISVATTVLYVPMLHNNVPLYDGTDWALHTIATELSQALSDTTKSPAAAVANGLYDLFIWDDVGTLRLSRGPPWTSQTDRGGGTGTTEIERVDGRFVNAFAISNGPAAQLGLYVGTIRVGTTGVDDDMGNRHCWNLYNRVQRPMAVIDPTANWVYSLGVWRQANGNAENQLDFVVGLERDMVHAEVRGACSASLYEFSHTVGIGLDSATADSATIFISSDNKNPGGSNLARPSAVYLGFPGVGRHTLKWLERSQVNGANVTTWYGTSTFPEYLVTTGIWGHVFA